MGDWSSTLSGKAMRPVCPLVSRRDMAGIRHRAMARWDGARSGSALEAADEPLRQRLLEQLCGDERARAAAEARAWVRRRADMPDVRDRRLVLRTPEEAL